MKYICIRDNQGGSFHVGDTMTAEEWKEWAESMNDFDEFDIEYQEKFRKLKPETAVEHIASIWDIDIVPFDKNNKEHLDLRRHYEGTLCEECGEIWTEQELNSYSWHCLKCGHKIGD